ncbi:unnamed protein product [Peronospora belbahrii]|uniref:M96 mating-specific protein family n=1 Tax=Peronospora belbahrii TaxID=622444 RepID=A0ABN8D2R0_9STRA|nr:unnamed protein product [Peronospora belbahrii]
MSFALLEGDDETFTDVLELLNEYEEYEAIDDTSQSQPRVKHCSSSCSYLSESPAWTAFEAAHPINHNTKKHRNRAREIRRQEVQFLRTCAIRLETELNALNEAVEQRAQLRVAMEGLDETNASSMRLWKELATRQLEHRLASERENSRLKGALEDHRKLREMLERVLNTRVARRVMETSLTQEKRTRRVHGVALEASDQEVFQELEGGVDFVYHEAAKVFVQEDMGNMTSPGLFEEKTLPFDLQATAEAAWRCLAHAFQNEKYTLSYNREIQKNDSEKGVHDNTVVESFGVEIKVADKVADFRIKQVFRRYVESDRIVIAWKSYIDPAEFKDPRMRFRFQEKGSMVIQQPLKPQVSGDEPTTLRIWHVITPEMLESTNNAPSSQFVQDLTDFVLNGSSSARTVQMIENMLLEESNRRNMQYTV